jgi:hypothetical protein
MAPVQLCVQAQGLGRVQDQDARQELWVWVKVWLEVSLEVGQGISIFCALW